MLATHLSSNRTAVLFLVAALLAPVFATAQEKVPNTTRGDLPSLVEPEGNLYTGCSENMWLRADDSNLLACGPVAWLAAGECTGANGGALTVNASNQVVCSDDDSGTGGTDTTCLDAGVDCLFAAAATEGGAATSATETAVTAHEAAITITEAQVSDLAHTVDTTCADGPCSLASGTTLNGATIQTGTDDDIPEADDFTNLTAGRSLTAPTTGTLDADVELYERTVAINIDPSHSTTDWIVFRAPRNIVVTGIDCIVASATSVVATVRECDANGANCAATEAAITCGVTNSTESGAIDDPNIDAGDYVRILRGTVTGTPGQLSVTVTYEAAD